MAQPSIREFAHRNGRRVGAVSNKDFNLYPPLVADSHLQLVSQYCSRVAGAVTVGAVAYFVYLGTTSRRVTAGQVLVNCTVVGTSTQVGEVGVFSTPLPPNRAAQTLTKLTSSAVIDTLATGTGIKGNTTAFGVDVNAGTHVWAGYRVDMAGTEPTLVGLGGDESTGSILSLAAAAAFTVTATYAGGLIAPVLTWQCPNLVLTVT